MNNSILKSDITVGKKVISCTHNKHLMDSLSSRSDIAPKGCHNGGCGICKIEVLSGEYESMVMSRKHITQEEEDKGIVLACRIFPRSDMEIKFIAKPKKITYTIGD